MAVSEVVNSIMFRKESFELSTLCVLASGKQITDYLTLSICLVTPAAVVVVSM